MASAKDVDILQVCQVSFGSRMSVSFSKGRLFHRQHRGLRAVEGCKSPRTSCRNGKAKKQARRGPKESRATSTVVLNNLQTMAI